MDNVKNDYYYVKRILRSVENLTRYLSDRSLDDLLNDGFLRDAVENRFTKIAEDTAHLTKEFKASKSDIPWGAITKIRNTVCHDYDVVDAASLYKTIKINFPDFRKSLLDTTGCHYMNLYPESFILVKNKAKTIEMRLYDDKRKQVKIGDLIVFKNTETKQELITEVIDLKVFNSFEELYSKYPKKMLGYNNEETANPKDMNKYYSDENIKKYGTLAIEIQLF